MFNLPALLKRSASLYAAHPLLFVAIASMGLPLAIAHRAVFPAALQLTDEPWLVEAWLAVVYAPFLMASYIVSGALVRAVATTYHGSHPSFTDSYGAVLIRLRSVLGVAIAEWGAATLLPLTIVGIPFSIYLMVRWLFSLQAVVIEDSKTGDALTFSSRLVKGIWWHVAGLLLLVAAFLVAPFLVMFFLLAPAHPAFIVIPTALGVVAHPFLACFSTLLFFRLRERALTTLHPCATLEPYLQAEGSEPP